MYVRTDACLYLCWLSETKKVVHPDQGFLSPVQESPMGCHWRDTTRNDTYPS